MRSSLFAGTLAAAVAVLLTSCAADPPPQATYSRNDDPFFRVVDRQIEAGKRFMTECSQVIGLPHGASIEEDERAVQVIVENGVPDTLRLAEVGPQKASELLELFDELLHYHDCNFGPETTGAVKSFYSLKHRLDVYRKDHAGDPTLPGTERRVAEQLGDRLREISEAVRRDTESAHDQRQVIIDAQSRRPLHCVSTNIAGIVSTDCY